MRFSLFLAAVVLVCGSCGRSLTGPLESGLRVQQVIVDNAGDVGYYSDVQLQPLDGQPAIAYYDLTHGDLKYAVLTPRGDWEVEIVDDVGDVGTYAKLRFNSFGQPNIVYYDETNAKPKFAFFNGAEWVVEPLAYSRPGGKFIGFDLDLNDVARISFVAGVNFNLEYAAFVPTSGLNETSVFTVDSGTQATGRGGNINQNTNLTLRTVGNDQFPVISYYNASIGVLQVAYYDPEHPLRFRGGPKDGWVYRGVDGGEGPNSDVGLWHSHVIEDNNILHLSYFDFINQQLKYAYVDLAGDSQYTEVVDTEGIVGQGTSITLDPQGIPTISYYDSTNNDLKVAIRAAGVWRTFRVDLKGIVGSFPSIVALEDGQIGVSYRDDGNGALKFAVFRAYGEVDPVDDSQSNSSATTDTADAATDATALSTPYIGK